MKTPYYYKVLNIFDRKERGGQAMARATIKATVVASFLLLCVFQMIMPRPAFSDTCSDGTGLPPFLGAETVKPNLLLMIDNSRSMYDLSYVENLSTCYDDSFAPASQQYAGYYLTIQEYEDDIEVWYEYEIKSGPSGKFSRTSTSTVDCNTANTSLIAPFGTKVKYGSSEVCVIAAEELVNGSLEQEILYFSATGKFLNWLVSSKMDIQKLALTGGKLVDPDGVTIKNTNGSISGNGDEYLVPESRGCNEQKMIKEITVTKNGSATVPATKLTLTVRSDGLDESDDNGDGFFNDTFIDIYGATQGGIDNESCERALGKFTAGGAPGEWKGDLDKCLGLNKKADNELITVYNEATQECWQVLSKGGPPSEGGSWGLSDVSATEAACEKFYIDGSGSPAKINKVQPWELTSQEGNSVTGSFCNGKWDDSSVSPNFVGRCWLPAGQSYIVPDNIVTDNNGLKKSPVLLTEEAEQTNISQGIQNLAMLSSQGADFKVGTEPQQNNLKTAVTPVDPENKEELNQERFNVIQALKEFISTNGSHYYRAKVLRAVKEFFVAEANAAFTFDVEEASANCTGREGADFRIVGGALGGSAYEYKSSGQTCYFGASNLAVPFHGYYHIFIKAPCGRSSEQMVSDVPLTVKYAGGSEDYFYDQATNCGDWVQLESPLGEPGSGPEGSFELLGDGTGGVLLTTNATGDPRTYVYADAVRFELYEEITTPLSVCDVNPNPGVSSIFEAEHETYQSTTNFQHSSSPEIVGKIDRVNFGPLDPPAEYYMHFREIIQCGMGLMALSWVIFQCKTHFLQINTGLMSTGLVVTNGMVHLSPK
jgi:hypothetical protein